MLFVCSSKGYLISFVVPRDLLSEAFWSPDSVWAGLESYDLDDSVWAGLESYDLESYEHLFNIHDQ